MTRRIIFIIIGALLFLALIALLWFWFLRKEAPEQNTGDFGTGDSRVIDGGTAQGGGNNQSQIPSDPNNIYNLGENEVIPLDGGTSGGGNYDSGYDSGGGGSNYTYRPPGVTWVNGGPLTNFNPTPINSVSNANINGTAYIPNPNDGGGSGGLSFTEALLGAGLTGVVACTPGLLGAGVVGTLSTLWTGIPVHDAVYTAKASSDLYKDFLDCIARTIARRAITQLTASTVDWINSGFDGKPAFVQDYKQFFTDIADDVAGDFLSGSGLAFLCSPFAGQVKIAIATSYAQSRGGEAPACRLSDAVGNVESFMNGTFSEGGWQNLLTFTTEPTNNPFGAYMYGKGRLQQAIAWEQETRTLNISPGGFLGTRKCSEDPLTGEERCFTVTPGSVIEDRLRQTLDIPIDENLLADSFDEIITALMNQLVTRTLQHGLTSLSGNQDNSTPYDAAAMAAATELLKKLQEAVSLAQKYGSVEQGSIADIQNAQEQLTTLENCWINKRKNAEARAAKEKREQLETRIGVYNTNITRANAAIARVQTLQSSALVATSLAEVQAVATQLTAAQNSGQLITQNDITLAEQNRTTLQSEMNSINQQTNRDLNQCYAS